MKKNYNISIILISLGAFFLLRFFRKLGLQDFLSARINISGFLINLIIILMLIIIFLIILFLYFFIIRTFLNVLRQKRLVRQFVVQNCLEIKKIDDFTFMPLNEIVNYFSSILNQLVITIQKKELYATSTEIKKRFPEISKSILTEFNDPHMVKIVKEFIKLCTDKISDNCKKYIR